jgi:hypothetical protein
MNARNTVDRTDPGPIWLETGMMIPASRAASFRGAMSWASQSILEVEVNTG